MYGKRRDFFFLIRRCVYVCMVMGIAQRERKRDDGKKRIEKG